MKQIYIWKSKKSKEQKVKRENIKKICAVEKSLNLLEEEKLHEEKKKCLILYDNNYMTKRLYG